MEGVRKSVATLRSSARMRPAGGGSSDFNLQGVRCSPCAETESAARGVQSPLTRSAKQTSFRHRRGGRTYLGLAERRRRLEADAPSVRKEEPTRITRALVRFGQLVSDLA